MSNILWRLVRGWWGGQGPGKFNYSTWSRVQQQMQDDQEYIWKHLSFHVASHTCFNWFGSDDVRAAVHGHYVLLRK